MQSPYLPGDEFADMVVEPEEALPLPRESGLFGEGGEGTDIERDAVRFLAAFKGVLQNTLQFRPIFLNASLPCTCSGCHGCFFH